MPTSLTALSGSETLPLWIMCTTLTVIVVVMVAAWVIHGIARQALEKADPEDIPEVLLALSKLLDRFHGFLPRRTAYPTWRRRAEGGSKTTRGYPSGEGGE